MKKEMQNDARKYGVKRWVALMPLILIAVVTLIGKTYRFHALPKVNATTLTSGSFPVMLSLEQARVISQEVIPIIIPDAIDGKLSPTSIFVKEGAMVVKGQPLLAYHQQQVDQLLVETKLLVIEAKEAVYQFKIGFEDATDQASKALDEATKELERATRQKDDKKISRLQKEFGQRQHELDIFTQYGYFMNTTLPALQWHLDVVLLAQKELDQIVANNYQITAPIDGYVMQRDDISIGSGLRTGAATFLILPNHAKYEIELPLPDHQKILVPSSNAQLTLFNEANANEKTTATFIGQNGSNLIMRPDGEGYIDFAKLKAYSLQLSSPFYQFMAPQEIVDENGMVYMLHPTSEEYIYTVSKFRVQKEKGNERYIVLLGAFPTDSMFILYPDNNITSGTQVFLQPD